jgi:uncharacterized protein YndB with AHSA1/START domain
MAPRTFLDEVHPTDRIYETITLRASWGRAWLAISNAREFGAWFGARFDGEFVPGATVRGVLEPTVADPEIAAQHARFAGLPIELTIEETDPDHRIAFRWHPFTVARDIGAAAGPMTRVELELNGDQEGVVLTVTESGFHQLLSARRTRAFIEHEVGWEQKLLLVKRYVERAELLDERWFRARARGYQLAATPP